MIRSLFDRLYLLRAAAAVGNNDADCDNNVDEW